MEKSIQTYQAEKIGPQGELMRKQAQMEYEILGKVKSIKGEYISIEVSENVVFKLQRSAIANILPKGTIDSIK